MAKAITIYYKGRTAKVYADAENNDALMEFLNDLDYAQHQDVDADYQEIGRITLN